MSLRDLIEADRATRSSASWYKSYFEQEQRQVEISEYVKPAYEAYEYYKHLYLMSRLQKEVKNDVPENVSEYSKGLESSLNQKVRQIESQQSLLNDLQSQLTLKESQVKELTSRVSLVTSQSTQLQLQLDSTHKLLEEKLLEIVKLKEELRAADDVNKMELIERIDRSEAASTSAPIGTEQSTFSTLSVPRRVIKTFQVAHMHTGANFICSSASGRSGGVQTLLVGSHKLHGLDSVTGETKFEIEVPGSSGTSCAVLCASLAIDNRTGILGTSESNLVVFDAVHGKVLKDLKGHNGKIKGCGFLGTPTKAFSAATDRTIKLWDLNRGGPIRSVPVVSQLIHGVCSGDGSFIVTGHLNGQISIWTQSDKVCEVAAHSESSIGVAMSPDGRYVASLGKDGTLAIFDLNMAHAGPVHTLRGFNPPVLESAPSFSDDSRMIAACTENSVLIWDCISGKSISQLQSECRGLCWVYNNSTGRNTLVTSYASPELRWWGS